MLLKYSLLRRYFKCDDLFFRFMSLSAFCSGIKLQLAARTIVYTCY